MGNGVLILFLNNITKGVRDFLNGVGILSLLQSQVYRAGKSLK